MDNNEQQECNTDDYPDIDYESVLDSKVDKFDDDGGEENRCRSGPSFKQVDVVPLLWMTTTSIIQVQEGVKKTLCPILTDGKSRLITCGLCLLHALVGVYV